MRTPLKTLLAATIAISLLSSLFPILRNLLALSSTGLSHFLFWQLFTYPFVEKLSFSLAFLIELGFKMYLLWLFGEQLLERARPKLFFILYFGAALIGALATLPFTNFFLAGSQPPVYAIMTAWMMLNPGSQMLFFFAIPIKSHFLVAGLILASLVLDIMAGAFVDGAALTASVLFGYLFSLVVWRTIGPFPILHPFERKVLRLLEKKNKGTSRHSKIYDIQSGDQVLQDDAFMDAMLDKISLYGQDSLTSTEKKRMKAISDKRLGR